MNLYECTECDRIFDNFPAANNHEKATGYVYLAYNVAYGVALAELVVCACGCGDVCHVTEAEYDDATNLAYINFKHMARSRVLA